MFLKKIIKASFHFKFQYIFFLNYKPKIFLHLFFIPIKFFNLIIYIYFIIVVLILKHKFVKEFYILLLNIYTIFFYFFYFLLIKQSKIK